MHRRTRFEIPMAEQKYQPKIEEDVKEKLQRNRQEAKYHYDRKAKVLPPLEIGQPVFVKLTPTEKEWTPATVVDPVSDRSTVVDVNGHEYRRDNVMIKPAQQIPKQETTGWDAELQSSTSEQRSSAKSPPREERIRPQRTTRLPRRFDDYETY